MRPLDVLSAIRAAMAETNIDAYLVTKFDPHQSEYAAPYWNSVKFVSGFTGSNAVAVITSDTAGLWTDGRYFIQAERELAGSGFTLKRTDEPGVKSYVEYIGEAAPINGAVGFDGRTVSAAEAEKLAKTLAPKCVSIRADMDLVGMIWEERPGAPVPEVCDHDVRFCGLSRTEKLALLRERMAATGGEYCVISSLDDIAWLFNLRCPQTECMTFPAYAAIGPDAAVLFTDADRVRKIGPGPAGSTAARTVSDVVSIDGVTVRPYKAVESYCDAIPPGSAVLIAPERTSFALKNAMKGVIIKDLDFDLTSGMKAVKNSTELACLERANLRDSVALCKFAVWLKAALAGGEAVTEGSAAEKLEVFRASGENYIRPSFETIAAYMGNAAMMHYSAGKSGGAALKPEGLLLVDSGGQYWDGTTDITRTFSLGPLTREIKTDFTLVLKSHIALAGAVFPSGTTGRGLDVLAREPMWERCVDYRSGTGHGIGFCLGVHESPPSISPRSSAGTMCPLEPGMIVTNEPGVYRENEYGIRTENTLCVEEFRETEFGRFLRFRVLSWFPIDLAAVLPEMLTEAEVDWVNWYHGEVFKRLSPLVGDEEGAWLREAVGRILKI